MQLQLPNQYLPPAATFSPDPCFSPAPRKEPQIGVYRKDSRATHSHFCVDLFPMCNDLKNKLFGKAAHLH